MLQFLQRMLQKLKIRETSTGTGIISDISKTSIDMITENLRLKAVVGIDILKVTKRYFN
jgi:hypothetical protein